MAHPYDAILGKCWKKNWVIPISIDTEGYSWCIQAWGGGHKTVFIEKSSRGAI